MEAAIRFLQQGDLNRARTHLEDYVRAHPGQVEALRLLGKIMFQQGDVSAGQARLRQALALQPDHADIVLELGVMALAEKRLDDAAQMFGAVLTASPGHAVARFNLAWVLRQQGQLDQAAAHLQTLLADTPQHVDALFNLANLRLDQQRPQDATPLFESILRQKPDHWQAQVNLAEAWRRLGQDDKAEELLRPLATRHANAANSLGTLLTGQNRLDEAEALFVQALALFPEDPHLRLNRALATLRRSATQAREQFLALIQASPDMAPAWNGLGCARLALDDYAGAEQDFTRAAALIPNYAEALGNLGKVQALLGRPREARETMAQAIAAAPENAALRSNYLFLLRHMDNIGDDEVFAAHQEFGHWLESRHAPLELPRHHRGEADRRLRVGYVSPDFRDHAVTLFFEPVLELHDCRKVEVFCYFCGTTIDDVTLRLKRRADHWRDIAHVPAQAAARQIRDDGIDILVDLAGHTAGNALTIFACKPAPIQVTWLGYPGTTGLTRIDYCLTDSSNHADNQLFYTEELFRLPTSAACFRPPASCPDVTPPPILENGFCRFGVFNKLGKANEQSFAAWSAILRTAPGARLLMVVPGGDDPTLRRDLEHHFLDHGVTADQLEIRGLMPLDQFLRVLSSVDVALDTFPYGGGTTSLLTLWMGVPLICLDGAQAASATGGAVLRAIGLEELVGASVDDYVLKAVTLAAAPSRLETLRHDLRPRLEHLPAFQEAPLVAALEDAYRQMWQRHLPPAPLPHASSLGYTPTLEHHPDPFWPQVVLSLAATHATMDEDGCLTDALGTKLRPHGDVVVSPAPALGLSLAPMAFLTRDNDGQVLVGTGDFTAECLVRPSAVPVAAEHSGGVMLIGQWGPGQDCWTVIIDAKGHACGWISHSGRSRDERDYVWTGYTGHTVIAGQWNHVALVRHRTTLALYLNGKGQSMPCPADVVPFPRPAPFGVGARGDGRAFFSPFPIAFDGVRITRGVARYQHDFAPFWNEGTS